jgi:serine/threonine protein kinase
LAGLLSKKRRLVESEVLGFMRDIVSGFIELAESNYLHRDLKLANIFLNSGIAKIADFGFAKKNKYQ